MGKFSDKGKDVSNFLQSNSLVAKTSFIILLVIVFIILFNLGINIIAYFLGPNKDPFVIKGMVDAQTPYTIKQDPNEKNSVTIYRSNNERNGIEFTWSVWIYISQSENFTGNGVFTTAGLGDGGDKYIQSTSTAMRHVFSKGALSSDELNLGEEDAVEDAEDDTTPYLSSADTIDFNAPGLYLELSNNLINAVVKMNTYDGEEIITVEGITKNKWMNIIIRCKNLAIDVYINGIVTKQAVLTSVPKQNDDPIYVAASMVAGVDGFHGKISDLRYFDNTINLSKIQDIVGDGPNLTEASRIASNVPDVASPTLSPVSDAKYDTINPPYLSFKWYLNKNKI